MTEIIIATTEKPKCIDKAERNRQNGRDFYERNKNTVIKCEVCQTCFKLPYMYRHRKTKKHIKLAKRFDDSL
jgi:hypothetical protein